jgi:transcriptional regulator with XRE-family HTH domain
MFHTIQLKPGALRSVMTTHGIETVSHLQKRTGLSRSQLDHITSGRKQPGAKFIGTLCAQLGMPFDELFEIVPVAPASAGKRA